MSTLPTFHHFPELPKEMRLKIYEDTFEPRILQLGVDAGVPYPAEMKPLGEEKGPEKQLHTRLPSLFGVCKESRELCKFIFVAFGPTFIHPTLDTLYISLYAIERMLTPDMKRARSDDGSSPYSVAAFEKAAIEICVKDIPEDLDGWKRKPMKWHVRHGIRELCPPGVWPATDYAEFFKYFGAPREVLVVTNGALRWAGGFSKVSSWRSIELVATETDIGDQSNLVECLKGQLPTSLIEREMEFTVVDAVKEDLVWLSAPYSWRTLQDMSERYMYI